MSKIASTEAATLMAREVTTKAAALYRALDRAEADTRQARTRMLQGNRPSSGLSGTVLGQTASDVDGASAALNTTLDLASAFLTEAEMTDALAKAAPASFGLAPIR